MKTDPYGVLARLREQSPAVAVETKGMRYWVITRYADVRRILTEPNMRDRPQYSHEINAHCVVRNDARRPRVPHDANRSLFYQEGDNHDKIRRLVATHSNSNLDHLADVTDEVVTGLVNRFRPGQQIDLMAEYARPIAVRVFCELAGIPASEQNMQAILRAVGFMSSDRSRIEQSVQGLVAWAKELVEIKRKEPADDLFSSILKLNEEIGLTHEQLTSEYVLAAIFGMEPANLIGNGAFLFLTHPDQLIKALARPTLFDTSVDEIVRYEPTFRFLSPHYTTSPLEVDGVTIPAGELLLLSVGGANRDPSFLADADVFDITRMPTGHLGFGAGSHSCVGAQLGRKQTATALRALFGRFPATKLVEPPDEAQWHRGKHFRKLDALPVILG
jgi:cytochrome P450